ncbi:hypothetical protein LTR27_001534 [Elasticomyces elasticus]|nr:hypothetical protein LTR27_001534 [Elasticomyces elasticus]
MARRVYKRRPMVALEEFFEISYGLSFYDATYTQLVDAAGLGCKLCDRILQCLRTTASDDGIALGNELPEDSVIAARVDEQSRRLELVTFDTSTLRRDDNWYDMVTVQGAGDAATDMLHIRPVNIKPGALASLNTARGWLRQCLEIHQNCPQPSRTFMPRRMVEATSDGQRSSFRVKDTYPDHVEPYAALSYCWGGDQTFKTTKAKLEHYRNGQAASVLTRTISDALITTMRLGLRYIWVDSLCVIQDDEKDKACEVAQMAKIYVNATVTIIASRAQTAWDGFLGDRPPLGARKPHAVFRLPCEAPNGLRSEIVLVGEEYEAVEPVEERGWTYQERVVSPRTLEFGTKRTFWSCSTLDNSSIAPSDGWSSETPHDMDRYRRVDRSTLAVMTAGGYTQSETPAMAQAGSRV